MTNEPVVVFVDDILLRIEQIPVSDILNRSPPDVLKPKVPVPAETRVKMIEPPAAEVPTSLVVI